MFTQSRRFPTIPDSGRPISANLGMGYFTDFYHYLVAASWPFLLFLIAVGFCAANVIFAIGYFFDGGIENSRPGSFADVFFFSVQTMATIGYGKMVPRSVVSNLLVSVEALTGLISLALVTGLIFAKFSRPTARVRFSRYAVVAPRNGVPCLMFRVANVRANQIVEAQIHVVFARQEVTAEGEAIRRYYDLDLIRYRNAVFALSWTVVHPIIESSPLYGADAELFEKFDASIVVSLTGLDGTFSQTVHARHFYNSGDILFGMRLTDIMYRLPNGEMRFGYERFDEVEPVSNARTSQ
jgi:inward rectifier potassium channel